MDYALLEQAYQSVSGAFGEVRPVIGMVLGSGWSKVVEAFDEKASISYEEIPGLGAAGVQGHAGRLSWVRAEGADVLVFQGRRHYYEGAGWTPIALPIYLLKRFGAETLILSNAAGGIAPQLKPGDIVAISDHLTTLSDNPLIGAANPVWGERFPDMSYVYTPALRTRLIEVGRDLGEKIAEGIYMMNSGPAYETPAQVRMVRGLGADVVGMSTVHEAMLARAAGMQVAGVVCVTNLAAGLSNQELSHREVLETTGKAMDRLQRLIVAFTQSLLKQPASSTAG